MMSKIKASGNMFAEVREVKMKRYFLTDHQMSTRIQLSDRKLSVEGGPGETGHYLPDVVFYGDYYSAGMLKNGRHGQETNIKTRYKHQGQEGYDEINGEGNSYAYEYRMSDPRTVRFWSLDPLAAQYAYNSPYAFSENKLINAIELEGLEALGLYDTQGNQLSGPADPQSDFIKNPSNYNLLTESELKTRNIKPTDKMIDFSVYLSDWKKNSQNQTFVEKRIDEVFNLELLKTANQFTSVAEVFTKALNSQYHIGTNGTIYYKGATKNGGFHGNKYVKITSDIADLNTFVGHLSRILDYSNLAIDISIAAEKGSITDPASGQVLLDIITLVGGRNPMIGLVIFTAENVINTTTFAQMQVTNAQATIDKLKQEYTTKLQDGTTFFDGAALIQDPLYQEATKTLTKYLQKGGSRYDSGKQPVFKQYIKK